jgi:hypothetical protein
MTWELGSNFGHLARLLPVASRLRECGHELLVAARDLAAAACVLQPAGISFVQSPHLTRELPLPHRPAGYSDILRAQGWGHRATLAALTEAWINLYRMFRPDIVLADYSPTATFAAHLKHVSCLLIGNGFQLPPATVPLPPFPGFSWATPEIAADSEALVVKNANTVACGFGGTEVTSLCELINPRRALFSTFPELDHYGPRNGAQYIGPLLGQFATARVDWPNGQGPRIFAYFRPDTSNLQSLLAALAASEARVVCLAAGFSSGRWRVRTSLPSALLAQAHKRAATKSDGRRAAGTACAPSCSDAGIKDAERIGQAMIERATAQDRQIGSGNKTSLLIAAMANTPYVSAVCVAE